MSVGPAGVIRRTTLLDRVRSRRCRHDRKMNLQKEKTTRASQRGWRVSRRSLLSPVAREVFLLTFPFIERANLPSSYRNEPFRFADLPGPWHCINDLSSDDIHGKVPSIRYSSRCPFEQSRPEMPVAGRPATLRLNLGLSPSRGSFVPRPPKIPSACAGLASVSPRGRTHGTPVQSL